MTEMIASAMVVKFISKLLKGYEIGIGPNDIQLSCDQTIAIDTSFVRNSDDLSIDEATL